VEKSTGNTERKYVYGYGKSGKKRAYVFTNIAPSVCCTSGLAGGVVLVEEIDVKVPFI
jgi:hypothetical protein